MANKKIRSNSSSVSKRVVDWHTGSEDDRNLAVMWTALRLPVQWRWKEERKWEDWEYEGEEDDVIDRNYPDYLDGLQLRLKPRR